jgi:predicted nucleic acid-binding protein
VPLRVSIDTNQFVSATILKRGYPFALIEEWRTGRFELITSLYQRNEIERVLSTPRTIAKYGVTE